ncbi:hypothetical protein DE146DRAFT_651296 [Phaeosphaeria sp. MPI-PUGE-AT-0046c]|nr:hypothetical protein DE146DRAFT_651296 [Phaeosphaeria sp. MPI-PUGE-AT-0046c]
MSQSLFTKAPLLRAAARRSIPRAQSASYSSTSGPKPSSSTHLRALIRQTTLRASASTLQRTSYTLTQQHSPFSTQPSVRARSPSPPPPYTARGHTALAPTQWTRFNTPYTLSSVRTFTASPSKPLASESPAPAAPAAPPHAPEVQARIDAAMEEITDLYGTAKDEFEIASEESEKNSTYAPDDRAAAREELDKLVAYYEAILEEGEEVAEEVRRRAGGRVRELVKAVEAMEEEAIHGD